MKKLAIASIGLALLLLAGLPVQAQRGQGKGLKANRESMYNTQTVSTIQGEVIEIIKKPAKNGPHEGMHLMVRSADETIEVHLGPVWFLENQEQQIALHDELTITGSRITYEEKPALIAASLVKGEETLTLRDTAGLPVWRGWKKAKPCPAMPN